MIRPRLRADLRAEVLSAEEVLLVGEQRSVLLEGAAAVAVVPLLDGRRTTAELAAAVAGKVPALGVAALLGDLARRGYLRDGDLDGRAAAARILEPAAVDAAAAAARHASARVRTVARSETGVDGIDGAVLAAGLTPAAPEEAATAAIVLADDYLDPGLDELAGDLAEVPWILGRPTGSELWIGPLFVPGEAGCPACVATRLRRNRLVGALVGAVGGERAAPLGWLPSTAATAESLLVADLARHLAGAAAATRGALITLDLGTLATTRHLLVPVPACPRCGSGRPDPPPQERVVLAPVCADAGTAGGHRSEQPSATLARLAPLVSPLLGIVRQVEPMTDSDDALHVWISDHNRAWPITSSHGLRDALRARNGGKGRSDAEAHAGAICEALERACGDWRGSEPEHRATRRALGPEALGVVELESWSEREWAEREQARGRRDFFHVPPPERLGSDDEVSWTRCWSLSADGPRWVPSCYAYYGHPEAARFGPASSNGCAAGRTLEEAVLQGALELIERDAVALWWYPRSRVPGLDLDSVADPWVQRVRRRVTAEGRVLWMLDITTDLGVPVYVALSRGTLGAPEQVLFGFGAHLEPAIALTRAIAEHNQCLAWLLAGAPFEGEALSWLREVTVATDPWLLPHGPPVAPRASGADACGVADAGAEVRELVARLAQAGIEVVVLDQSRADVDLRVVRTIAPGLRSFWRRLGPGRLYDVPPRLGWTERAPTEEGMNPRSVFF